jgi:hypothetical protein
MNMEAMARGLHNSGSASALYLIQGIVLGLLRQAAALNYKYIAVGVTEFPGGC